MSYQDKTIVCADCSAEFKFTGAEQQLFAEKGFTSEPKRCKPCRELRKGSQVSGNRDGGNYASSNTGSGYGNSGGGYSGGRDAGRGGFGQNRGNGGGNAGGRSFGGPKQMFPATCGSCGKQTEVPFKPSGSRPVYCRECFQSQKPGR